MIKQNNAMCDISENVDFELAIIFCSCILLFNRSHVFFKIILQTKIQHIALEPCNAKHAVDIKTTARVLDLLKLIFLNLPKPQKTSKFRSRNIKGQLVCAV